MDQWKYFSKLSELSNGGFKESGLNREAGGQALKHIQKLNL